MTETAKTIIQVASAFGGWVASHVVTLGALVTAILPVLTILKWVHLTTDELSGLQLGIAGIIAAITGQGTVSKMRFNERVEEKVEAKVAKITEAKAGV